MLPTLGDVEAARVLVSSLEFLESVFSPLLPLSLVEPLEVILKEVAVVGATHNK